MKYLMLLLLSFQVFAVDMSRFNVLGDTTGAPHIPSTAWYWNPDEPGMGMSVSIQQSEFGVGTDYIVFAGIYTYKPDGSQAWYTIQGDYIANPDFNAWHEVKSQFGTPWGPTSSYMGKLTASLFETSDGMVLGSSEYKPNDIWIYKSTELVWRNPHTIDVYVEGVKEQTFYRNTYHGDTIKGSANVLTKNYYRLIGAAHGISKQSNGDRPKLEYVNSAMSFQEFNPDIYFTGSVATFKNVTEYDENKVYYISEQPVGHIEMIYDYKAPTVHQVFKEVNPNYRKDHYVVMVYDKASYMLSGYYFYAHNNNDPQKGLTQAMGDYKFMGYLSPSDQGMMALYPAACQACKGTNNESFKPEFTRRSVWYLYPFRQDNGEAWSKLPDVDKDIKPWLYYEGEYYD
jgi:hypothetical protein